MTTLAELLYGGLEHATRDLRERAPALLAVVGHRPRRHRAGVAAGDDHRHAARHARR